MDGDRVDGKYGWAQRAVHTATRVPQQATTVDQWLMRLPGQGVGWEHFCLAVVHLADTPGMKPAVRRYPQATHELLLLALRRDPPPVIGDWRTWKHLEPANYVRQFHGIDDGEIRKMLHALAAACVNGRLPAETQMYVELDGQPGKMMTIVQATQLWDTAVAQCIHHSQTGGHHGTAN